MANSSANGKKFRIRCRTTLALALGSILCCNQLLAWDNAKQFKSRMTPQVHKVADNITADNITIVDDSKIGIKLAVPEYMATISESIQFGTIWRSERNSLTAALQKFPNQSLPELFAELIAIPGLVLEHQGTHLWKDNFTITAVEPRNMRTIRTAYRFEDAVLLLTIKYRIQAGDVLPDAAQAIDQILQSFDTSVRIAMQLQQLDVKQNELKEKRNKILSSTSDDVSGERADEADPEFVKKANEYAALRKELDSLNEKRYELTKDLILLGEEAAQNELEKAACSNECTIVPIFFGTNRNWEKQERRIVFNKERLTRLQLGQALVTVPKKVNRNRGQILRPSWIDKTFWRTPPEGDPSRHFTIPRNGVYLFGSTDEFIRAVDAHANKAGHYRDHAFIFVHGYNVTFDQALYRTAQISYDLGYDLGGDGREPFGTPFMYSWPSAGEMEGYLYDQDSARQAIPNLKEFLEIVEERTGAKHLHLIAHSMGNIALLEALERFAAKKKSKGTVGQVILAAPDMDVADFEVLAKKIIPIAQGVTLYASSDDLALIAARKARLGAPRAGGVLPDGPIVIDNLYSIDVTAVGTEIFSIKHSEYADRRILLNDMSRIFIGNEQPPHERSANFARQKHKKFGKWYWRYID